MLPSTLGGDIKELFPEDLSMFALVRSALVSMFEFKMWLFGWQQGVLRSGECVWSRQRRAHKGTEFGCETCPR